MSIRVISPGLYSTIQDTGRCGWRHTGLTAGGAMDNYALRIANLLVGNASGAAGLELTLVGAKLLLQQDTLLALCGAYMAPQLQDGTELPMWRPVLLPRGAQLTLGRAEVGCRAYIAVAGGFTVPLAMGGRGTDARAAIGGLAGRPLAAGDVLPCAAAASGGGTGHELPPAAAQLAAALRAAGANSRGEAFAAAPWFAPPVAYGGGDTPGGIVLRAMPGAQSGQFSAAARALFYREPYRVAPASDRMGCRLLGPMLEYGSRAELLSHGVTPGTVQVPPGGSPIILAADCQTTGGYPKLAHVITADLPLLAQAKPGDYVRFAPVTLDEAQRLDLARELYYRQLQVGIQGRIRSMIGRTHHK